MIRCERFANKRHELGFKYKLQGVRAWLYKRPTQRAYVAVLKGELIDDQYVRSQLLRAGYDQVEVEAFIAQDREAEH